MNDFDRAATLLEQYRREGGDMSAMAAAYQAATVTGKTPLGLNQWVLTDKPRMEEFNEDNRIIDAELRKKANAIPYQKFSPQLLSADRQGAWQYDRQWGEYKILDEFIFYSFYIVITNKNSGGGTGTLKLSMPKRSVGQYAAPIAHAVGTIPSVSSIMLWSSGSLVVKTADHKDKALTADMVTSERFGLAGQIFYRSE